MARARRSNARPDAANPSSSGMPAALERPWRVRQSVYFPGKWFVNDRAGNDQYFDSEFGARMYAAAHKRGRAAAHTNSSA